MGALLGPTIAPAPSPAIVGPLFSNHSRNAYRQEYRTARKRRLIADNKKQASKFLDGPGWREAASHQSRAKRSPRPQWITGDAQKNENDF
jgi:hypothetical protein